MARRGAKRTRLSLGPRQIERLLVALSVYTDTLWPEGEDEPRVSMSVIRENQVLAEAIRKARDSRG
jgi:hypothetical protein